MPYAGCMETTGITEEKVLGLGDLRTAWQMYTATFAPMAARAAQRHVMYWEEFAEMADDPRITKHLSWQGGDLVGLGVQTTELDSWHLIAPEFFEAQYPDLFVKGHIWYVGFVCTRQDPRPPAHTFGDLIKQMSAPTREVGGVSVMDFCTWNERERRLDKATSAILSRVDPFVSHSVIDAQSFHAYRFSAPL